MTARKKLAAARHRKGWSQEDLAEQVGVSRLSISLWECGKKHPYPSYVHRLCEIFGATPAELGLEAVQRERGTIPLYAGQRDSAHFLSPPEGTSSLNLSSRLMAIPLREDITCWEVQQELEEFLEASDTEPALLKGALASVATFPISCGKCSLDQLLNYYAAGICACSYLSNYGHEEIQLVASLLATYTPVLKAIVEACAPSYRALAAGLATQAIRLRARPAAHLETMTRAVAYGEEALDYARESGDQSLLVLTLRGLLADYEFNMADDPARRRRALHIAEEACHLAEGPAVPALLQSWAYTGLAKCQALYGQEQEMMTSLGKAEELLAASPHQHLSGQVSHSLAHLFRHKAIAYAYLGQQDKAFHIFSEALIDINGTQFASKLPMVARNRLGVLSEFTFSALYLPRALKDKELSIALWKQKAQEARALQSESYFREAQVAYRVMKGIWSEEADVLSLTDLLAHW